MNAYERNSSLNILKIIAIFFILLLHYLNKSMGGGLVNDLNIYGILTHSIESFCIIACNIFVLITGYFSVNKKEIKLSKIIDIILIILFYGIVIYVFYLLLFNQSITLENLKIFVKTIGRRWFPIIYIILYTLIPYLNSFTSKLNKKQFKTLILIFIFFFSIWPTFFTNITISDSGYGIINFILLYFLGNYIRKYNIDFNISRLCIIFFSATLITTMFSFISATRAWAYNSFFVLIQSISFFLIFKKLDVKYNRIANNIASYSLEIYIIHENAFITEWLYKDVCRSQLYYYTPRMFINMITTVFIIFIICFLIDYIRRIIFKFTLDKLKTKFKIYNKIVTL